MATEITRIPELNSRTRTEILLLTCRPLLASDSTRDAVIDYLALAHSEGFMTLEAYKYRSERALRSRNEDQLSRLLSDLPDEIARQVQIPARADSWPLGHIGANIALVLFLIAELTVFVLLIGH
jgi:hypothetical protein